MIMGSGRTAYIFKPEEIRAVAEAMIHNSMNQKAAAAAVGISKSAFGDWLRRIMQQTGLDLRTVSGAVNARDWGKILSRGDRIRAMTDDQLALKILSEGGGGVAVGYCSNNGKCKGIDLENEEIQDAGCLECIKNWLEEVPE